MHINSQESFDQVVSSLLKDEAVNLSELEAIILNDMSLIKYYIKSQVVQSPSESVKTQIINIYRHQFKQLFDIEVNENFITFKIIDSLYCAAEIYPSEKTLLKLPGTKNKDHFFHDFLDQDVLKEFQVWFLLNNLNNSFEGKVSSNGIFNPNLKTPFDIVNKGLLLVEKPSLKTPDFLKNMIFDDDVVGSLKFNFSQETFTLSFSMDYKEWTSLFLSERGKENSSQVKKALIASGVAAMVLFSNSTTLSAENGEIQKKTSSISNRKLRVGVLDTGVDYNNKLLKGFAPKDSNDKVYTSHGTSVAGVMADTFKIALGDEAVDRIEIVNFSFDVNAGAKRLDESYLGQLKKAVNSELDVLNISSSGPFVVGEMERKLIEQAILKGIKVVAASGNDGTNQMTFPCSIQGVICVGSINRSGKVSKFSNIGPNVSLYAEGENRVVQLPNNKKGIESGTSFSAPFVSAMFIVDKINSEKAEELSKKIKSVDELEDYNLIVSKIDSNN